MKQAKLILVRHGQSMYNRENLFTGWTDTELSEQGQREAKEVGKMLKEHAIYPDICFTSWLKRAIHTGQIALHELGWEHIDTLKSYKLNERHYGDWQGKDKDAVKKEYGEELFLSVRRGYDVPPPKLDINDKRSVWNDAKYKDIKHENLPRSESLEDTKKRVMAYYEEAIASELKKGKTVLISAHGNSLRALVMYLEHLDKDVITNVEISTGMIITYSFDNAMNIDSKNILKKL